jgi:hypothetical protein
MAMTASSAGWVTMRVQVRVCWMIVRATSASMGPIPAGSAGSSEAPVAVAADIVTSTVACTAVRCRTRRLPSRSIG